MPHPVIHAEIRSEDADATRKDEVLFFVAVDDVAATLGRGEELGGTIVRAHVN
jgi:hypothetical protein